MTSFPAKNAKNWKKIEKTGFFGMVSSRLLQDFKRIELKLKKMNEDERS